METCASCGKKIAYYEHAHQWYEVRSGVDQAHCPVSVTGRHGPAVRTK